jgi:hypothetical protein
MTENDKLRGMSPEEAVDMMQRCKHEIAQLRGTVNHLKPKAEAYDALCAVIGLLPRKSQGESIDLIWSLDKRIAELTPKPVNKTESA